MKIKTPKINWVGPQFVDHSLAIVNRSICRYLQENHQIDLRIKVPEPEMLLSRFPTAAEEEKKRFLPFPEADFTIVHQWPPDWKTPKSRHWICMQPWEYGAIPREWYIPMKYWADEIWVYSLYNKESYTRCGIPKDKIHVIPLGVDEKIFHNGVEAMALEPFSFRFLFVGGTIGRKGIDILIQAYLNEFTADDDVCLFVKDTGTRSFYKGITLEKMILEAISNPNNPRIVYMDNEFSEAELARLYKACNCLVHPYRGEGFGLTIAEAMACGTSVIVPDKGSCRDFCSEETAFFVSSEEVVLSEKKVSNLDTVDYPWWLSIDRSDLQQVMRFAYENRVLVKEKGQKASQQILSSFTWGKSAQVVVDRVKQLAEKEPNPKLTDEDIIKMELEYGNELYVKNLIEDALGVYLNILSTYPSLLMARYNAAIIYIRQKNYISALEHLVYIFNNMGQENKDFQENIWLMMRVCYSEI
ncbi:glycosyltransferase [Bacillus sp. FJAT-53711]|uniref:Glycosyltransferase n=1 Tax=Bacillus yunxiaonensis TaxID=3127665 RepID=A0ABU8FQE9_9BACI